MKNKLSGFITLVLLLSFGCNSNKAKDIDNADKLFATFENVFLDACWKEYPSQSIQQGYGKYYDEMVIPDSASFDHHIAFSKQWTDTLNRVNYDQLSDNNKISFRIIVNQLESDTWYTSVFKQQEW